MGVSSKPMLISRISNLSSNSVYICMALQNLSFLKIISFLIKFNLWFEFPSKQRYDLILIRRMWKRTIMFMSSHHLILGLDIRQHLLCSYFPPENVPFKIQVPFSFLMRTSVFSKKPKTLNHVTKACLLHQNNYYFGGN